MSKQLKHLLVDGQDYEIVDNSARTILDTKQDILTAGSNISISDNVISAVDTIYDDTELREIIDTKQDTLTSGDNIIIDNNIISSNQIDDSKSSEDKTWSSSKIDEQIKDAKLVAGDNITIGSDNVISAVDTTYTSSGDIKIDESNNITLELKKETVTNSLGYIPVTSDELNTKQNKLVSDSSIVAVDNDTLVVSNNITLWDKSEKPYSLVEEISTPGTKAIHLCDYTGIAFQFQLPETTVTILSEDNRGFKYALQWKIIIKSYSTDASNPSVLNDVVYCRGNVLPPDFDNPSFAYGLGIGGAFSDVATSGICPIYLENFLTYWQDRSFKDSNNNPLDESFYLNARVYVDSDADNFIEVNKVENYESPKTSINTGPTSPHPWHGVWDGSDYDLSEHTNLIDENKNILIDDLKSLVHKSEIDKKQDKLIQGSNINISNDTISAIVPTNTSELNNDSGFITDESLEDLTVETDDEGTIVVGGSVVSNGGEGIGIQYYDIRFLQSDLSWSLQGGGWYHATYPIDEAVANKTVLFVTIKGIWANGSWDNFRTPSVGLTSDNQKLSILIYGLNSGITFNVRVFYKD